MQSNNKKPVVVGIGELLWDMLPTGKKAGGAPINFVYHASRLGAEGYAISAVGDDGLGREILEELDNKFDPVSDRESPLSDRNGTGYSAGWCP